MAHLNAFQPIAADSTCKQAVRSRTIASVRTGAPLKLADVLMAASFISMMAHASAMYSTGSGRSKRPSEQVRRMKATLWAWLVCRTAQGSQVGCAEEHFVTQD